MTPKQAEQIRILHAKASAGLPIKESEWPSWMKCPPVKGGFWRDEGSTYGYLGEYEKNMQAKHGAGWEPNPTAVDWGAYQALERGEHCEVCGRPGEEFCQPCHSWRDGLQDRKRIRRATAAA